MVALIKLIRDVHTYHPLPIAQHLSPLLNALLGYILPQEQQQRRYPDKFLTLCMLTVREVLNCGKYKPSLKAASGVSDAATQAMAQAYETLQAVLHEQTASGETLQSTVVMQLMQHYLGTSDEEREQWTEDGEEYAVADIGSSWEFILKPCAEHLFATLLGYNVQELGPIVLSLLQQCTADSSLELRDAVYNALGLCAYDLAPTFDINPMLPELLQQYSSITSLAGSAGSILQRRILLLLGHWQCINIAKEPRPAIYSLIVSAMLPETDTVIKLTAAMTLERFTIDQGFEPEDFEPLLGDCMQRLFQMFSDVEQCSTKLRLLSCITELVNCMEGKIVEYVPALIDYVPTLWQQAEEHELLQTAVIRCTVKLLDALRTTTPPLEDFCVQLIAYGADLSQPQHTYLCDDVLLLWHQVLQASPELTETLVGLYQLLPALLEQGNESLRTCILIIESYLLFSSDLLSSYHQHIAQALPQLWSVVPQSSRHLITRVIHIALMSQDLCLGLQPFLLQLVQNFLFENNTDRVISTAAIGLLARVALLYPEHFMSLMDQCSNSDASAINSFWAALIEQYDSITYERWKKLIGMLCAAAFNTYSDSIGPHANGLLNICTAAIYSLHARGDGFVETDMMVIDLDDYQASLPNQSLRQAHYEASDPVGKYSLRSFVAEQLGGVLASEASAGLDPTIVDRLREVLPTE
eukprot:TRINITY_DN11156_c0_g1_i4.p1 TRINITY_DN11156_c0_g1~~TRINITY_DN11156_c0_g1_i4.p1  ORF type:complete len:787 (+),score=185.73 TRINITY_DN11156_c0_g1_i4:275-2362(+)